MVKQVITISPTGAMAGLQHKPGKGLDLRQFGKASIKRASSIEWDEDSQRWTVLPLSGPTAMQPLTVSHMLQYGRDAIATVTSIGLDGKAPWTVSPADVLQFEDYDAAVSVEIAYFNALRLSGRMN